MKKLSGISLLLLLNITVQAQVNLPVYPDSVFSTYYQQRVTHFKTLPKKNGDIIFLGNSITDGAEWSELFEDNYIKNRGISGDITAGVINRLDEVANRKPAKVFLLIGVNDLSRNVKPDSVVKNILFIADYLHAQTPSTQLYIQSILPVNNVYRKFSTHTDKTDQINQVNRLLQQNASGSNYTYIDIHTAFCDEHRMMRADLTNDGLHLKGEGYLLWKHLIFPYLLNLQLKPALLPLPRSLQWDDGVFPAYQCHVILADGKLGAERSFLKNLLDQKNIHITRDDTVHNEIYIALRIAKIKSPQSTDEAYHLQVTSNKVVITASSAHGIFNGIQTLRQLMRDDVMIDNCNISDWPAFSWRGYMVDVGRNFQSVEQLEQQIGYMALYKLNVFHLHLTEDIAWRLYIKKYPQLTNADNMLRDKGMYYTPEELQELIGFCNKRHILFVPEIDMPGHSAAFKRAFKTDMQSDTGILILKNILAEVCKTYRLKYLHIGADEVKITNPNFLPQIISFVNDENVQTIGWSPGGSMPAGTIRQLWMKEGVENNQLKYVDSRNLYLNHMDPLESVVAIYNRKIGDRTQGDHSLLGGEICVWNDRAVNREQDLLLMNPVYPAMLAFAERSWRGGGESGWTTTIGAPGTKAAIQFTEFETRLADQNQENFKGIAFPYHKQASTTWSFYGPYFNDGKAETKFKPETERLLKDSSSFKATGGTIVLRHWWYPLVKGVIDRPKENTTWYAKTEIWSDHDGYSNFWIGFNNLSRSYATDTPEPGTWDDRHSAVWVNNHLVAPPNWKHAGRKEDMETPLIDEGYEYREPSRIFLKAGWNRVLIKLPVMGFRGRNAANPVKWMFTFVEAD
ncbi:MAG: hypothetical protein NVSMB24_32980 [Mucilaginibacter sp.]